MKRLSFLSALCLVACAGFAVAGDQDFKLVNATGVEIEALFVSPTGEDQWGADVLGVDTLPDGESVDIVFHPEAEAAYWDLKIADDEGNSVVWKKIKLTQVAKITLRIKNGEAIADLE